MKKFKIRLPWLIENKKTNQSESDEFYTYQRPTTYPKELFISYEGYQGSEKYTEAFINNNLNEFRTSGKRTIAVYKLEKVIEVTFPPTVTTEIPQTEEEDFIVTN